MPAEAGRPVRNVSCRRGFATMVVEHRTIAIGGSTGAVKDLKRILAALPADFPAPVFIVIHVGAQGRNLLAKSFEGCGPFPVRQPRMKKRSNPAMFTLRPQIDTFSLWTGR